MKIEQLTLPDLFLISGSQFEDSRGSFLKIFNIETFKDLGINLEIKELFFSISHKDVIRGMHFQTEEFSVDKLIYVSQGSIVDVALDLRKNSSTYGKHFTINLSAKKSQFILVPKGFAHGFMALEDNSIVHYAQSNIYSKPNDAGVRYDSFGYTWPTSNPIVSERDLSFENFNPSKHYF